jgi:hypothetical protein
LVRVEAPTVKPKAPEPQDRSHEPVLGLDQDVWCTESGCSWHGSITNLDQHVRAAHFDPTWNRTRHHHIQKKKVKKKTPRQSGLSVRSVPVSTVPFELLPPGEWNMDRVLRHYRRVGKSTPFMAGRELDVTRLRTIASLHPTRCYVGKESWTGYVAFEFSKCRGVVVECPFKGNATYVIAGNDWYGALSLTKAEVRSEWRHWRIVHSSNWLRNLKAPLRRIGYILRKSEQPARKRPARQRA